jgi:6,7-dimethyl-8-ribityllumazine synthase
MASNLKNLSEYKKTELNVLDARIGIVVSEWNEEITDALAKGAIDTLLENGIEEENIIIKYVPGTFELALGAQLMVDSLYVDAAICLGCVIQGETRHFDFICNASANAIAKVNLETETPVIFGVLTTDNQQQAIDRSGGKYGNKGVEGAMTALKMISLVNETEMENEELLDFFDDDIDFIDDEADNISLN